VDTVEQEVEEKKGQVQVKQEDQVQVKQEDQGLDLGELLKLEYSAEPEVEKTGVNPGVNSGGNQGVYL
jgi:hypothetical protein